MFFKAIALVVVTTIASPVLAGPVEDQALAMCGKNETNGRSCEFMSRSSVILNLCELRRNGDLTSPKFNALLSDQVNAKQLRPWREELIETMNFNCSLFYGVKFK